MKPAWRGVVLNDGTIWAWPTVLMTHTDAFCACAYLAENRARWRQWAEGGPVDFDPDTSVADKAMVNEWVARASG